MAGAIYQTKLTADTSQHDQALGRSANQVYNYKTKVEKADKQLGGMISSFKKYASVIGAAKIAYDTFNKALEQSDAWTDKWKGSLEGAGGAINQLSYQLGSLDFSNLVSNLQVAWSNAKNLYDALDALATFNVINDEVVQELKTQLEELRTRAREGEDVSEEIKAKEAALEQALLDAIPRIQAAKMALIKSALQWDDRYDNEGWGWADSQAEQLWNYVIELKKSNKNLEDELDRAEANLKRHTKGMTNAQMVSMPQEWKDEWTRLKKEVEAYRLAVKITDDEMRKVFEQNEALRGIRREMAQTKRQDLRYVDYTKGLKGAPKTEVPVEPVIPEGSIAELEKKLSDLKLKWRMATTDEGNEGRIAIKKLIDQTQADLDKMMGVEKKPAMKVDVDTDNPPEGSIAKIRKLIAEAQAKLDNSTKPEDRIQLRVEIEGLNKQMEDIAKGMKTPAEEIKEEIDAIEKKYKEMGETVRTVSGMMANAVSTWAEIDQLAFEANEENMTEAEKAEHKRTQAYIKGTAQIIDAVGQAIPAILSLVGAEEAEALAAGTAQAAKLAYPANLAAIATVVASVMTVAATIASLINASKFANGGIVDAASRVGDHNIIRVNGGEMILNDRQQSNLFKLLNGEFWAYYNSNNFGLGKHETIQLRISGSDLVGTLDNYNRQQGRAR